jgi:hypothetical protein
VRLPRFAGGCGGACASLSSTVNLLELAYWRALRHTVLLSYNIVASKAGHTGLAQVIDSTVSVDDWYPHCPNACNLESSTSFAILMLKGLDEKLSWDH